MFQIIIISGGSFFGGMFVGGGFVFGFVYGGFVSVLGVVGGGGE